MRWQTLREPIETGDRRWLRELTSYRITLVLIAVLLQWYTLQIIIAGWFGFGITEIRHWFKLSINGGVNPGWLVAGISNRFPPFYGHLVNNVMLLAVFGGASERHLTNRQYLLFFFGAGFTSLYLDSLYWAFQGTNAVVMGSSGAIYGLIGFYCNHSVRHHDDLLTFMPDKPGLSGILRFARTMFVIILPIAVGLLLTAELFGVEPSGKSATVAHLSGFLLGYTLDYAASTRNGHPTLCTAEKC